MTSPIWNCLEKGVRFENTDIVIPWRIAIGKLPAYGAPALDINNGQYSVVWNESVLLNGIAGPWYASYFPHEAAIPFKSVGLFYTGDAVAQERYKAYSNHLITHLGQPHRQDEQNGDKEMIWRNNDYYVQLYLFDMHVFRCALNVGVK